MVAALLLVTVSLHTPEAAVQNNSNAPEAIISFEMAEHDLYKAYLPDQKAQNAYKRYVKNYLSSNQDFPGHSYKLCDINNDGISEMFFAYNGGVRTTYKIYTYKQGKIIKMGDFSGCNLIAYNKNKKQICIEGSNGASHSIQTCYKMVSSKLNQTSKYESISNYSGGNNETKYYKNNKRISAKKYNKFSKRIFKWPNI